MAHEGAARRVRKYPSRLTVLESNDAVKKV